MYLLFFTVKLIPTMIKWIYFTVWFVVICNMYKDRIWFNIFFIESAYCILFQMVYTILGEIFRTTLYVRGYWNRHNHCHWAPDKHITRQPFFFSSPALAMPMMGGRVTINFSVAAPTVRHASLFFLCQFAFAKLSRESKDVLYKFRQSL